MKKIFGFFVIIAAVMCAVLVLSSCGNDDKEIVQSIDKEGVGTLYEEEIQSEKVFDAEKIENTEESHNVKINPTTEKKEVENDVSSNEVQEEIQKLAPEQNPQANEITEADIIEELAEISDVAEQEVSDMKEQLIDAPTEETAETEQKLPEKNNKISLTVDCTDILNNIDALKKEKHSILPADGVIFSSDELDMQDGDSVFEILKRTLTSCGIHLEFNLAPITSSAYIEGIGNIYEFDCGQRSGWKYSVNGEFPRVGCSEYKVKPGDKIVFIYRVKAY